MKNASSLQKTTVNGCFILKYHLFTFSLKGEYSLKVTFTAPGPFSNYYPRTVGCICGSNLTLRRTVLGFHSCLFSF